MNGEHPFAVFPEVQAVRRTGWAVWNLLKVAEAEEIPACAGKTAYFGDSSLRWKDGIFWRFQPSHPNSQKAVGDPGRWNDGVVAKTFRLLDP
ncbi:MAG TPA: hypothetical protein PL188_02140 [Candidatus Cloacimonadota bacterium]|nr:hypothetical protein [Candidatus Cloacimonadota bacterium]